MTLETAAKGHSVLHVALAVASSAAPVALEYFRAKSLDVENKSEDGFDPVTHADRAVEKAMRETLMRLRPNDAILGEEFQKSEGASDITWILDPIDGTRAFICGAPSWGTLIATQREDKIQAGVISLPFTNEIYYGDAAGGFLKIGTQIQKLETSERQSLKDARLMTTFPEVGNDQERAGFQEVAKHVTLTRYGLDCYAYALLAAGHIDLVIEAGLHLYDIAGPIGVIEAAGGLVTDWRGGSALQGGQVIAAANPMIHEAALALLEPFSKAAAHYPNSG